MSAVPSLTLTPDGEELAPDECFEAGPEDCANCDKRDSCVDA
jgi:hypothetical protein